MTCLKDLKISEIKKLDLVYYSHPGVCLGFFVGDPYVVKYDCVERKKDFYKDYWMACFFSCDEHRIFTTLQEAEDYIKHINNKKERIMKIRYLIEDEHTKDDKRGKILLGKDGFIICRTIGDWQDKPLKFETLKEAENKLIELDITIGNIFIEVVTSKFGYCHTYYDVTTTKDKIIEDYLEYQRKQLEQELEIV